MRNLYLVRHGQTDGNQKKLWIGARTQYKLNQDGRHEAMWAGAKLRELELDSEYIYASPVERAFETAKIIQSKVSLPIIPIPDLSEMFFGDLEGVDELQFKTDFPFAYEEWLMSSVNFTPPNGESGRRFLERAVRVIQTLAVENETGDAIIVTHAGIIKLFLAYIMGANLDVGYKDLKVPEASTGSITKILMHDGKYAFVENIEQL